jgi:hypothetical protein
MMVEILIVAEPDNFILLKMQENRPGLTAPGSPAIRPESRDDRRIAYSS